MKSKWIWIVAAATLAACNCEAENNGDADMGNADMAEPDEGSPDMPDPDGSTNIMNSDAGPDARLPEGVSIPGLSSAVTVRFDEHGVMHAECETSADCFAAQGYYHASHRFIQMDIQRRFASGRLSGLIGNAALTTDVEMRAIMSTRDGQPLEEALWEATSDETKAQVTAYTRGVNAFLEDYRRGRNGAELSAEYDLELVDASEIPEWTELDSVSAALLLLESLSNEFGDELGRANDLPELTPEAGLDILGTQSATQVATMPASGETYDNFQTLLSWPEASALRPALDRLRPKREMFARAYRNRQKTRNFLGLHQDNKASNNWVIHGDRTASGSPILANDPHLGMQNPALWYLVELNSDDGLHVAGVSLPGLPGVLLGHNEDVAWGGTVVFWDLTDIYTEDLNADGSAVMFEGDEVPIIEVEHEFEVARSNPETRTLRFVPHHGPMFQYDADAGEAITLRWAGADARTDLDMFFELFRASNIDEAKAAISKSTATNQNWIVADSDGNIGWFPFNKVPRRPWASLSMPPWLPLPGDGSAEWGEPIPLDELPQMRNPANDFIATANTDPLGTSFDADPTNEPYPYLYSYGEVGGFRQDAVVRRIEAAGDSHTPETSQEMQGDTFLVLRDWIRPGIQEVIDANQGSLSAEAETFWSQIEAWDGTCPTGLEGRDPEGPKSSDTADASIGCAAFHMLLFTLSEATFGDDLNGLIAQHDWDHPIRTLVIMLNDPGRLQQSPEVYWDNQTTDFDETKDDIILGALENATTRISDALGTDPDDWRWGRIHTLLMQSNVFNDAGFTQFNYGPFAAPGGLHAINVADPRSPSDEEWLFTHGPSMRHVSTWTADGIVSRWTLPGGQRHHRESPFYDNLLDDWLAVNHFQMPFRAADVESAAQETVTVEPR